MAIFDASDELFSDETSDLPFSFTAFRTSLRRALDKIRFGTGFRPHQRVVFQFLKLPATRATALSLHAGCVVTSQVGGWYWMKPRMVVKLRHRFFGLGKVLGVVADCVRMFVR